MWKQKKGRKNDTRSKRSVYFIFMDVSKLLQTLFIPVHFHFRKLFKEFACKWEMVISNILFYRFLALLRLERTVSGKKENFCALTYMFSKSISKVTVEDQNLFKINAINIGKDFMRKKKLFFCRMCYKFKCKKMRNYELVCR